jgi:hypothetical protein
MILAMGSFTATESQIIKELNLRNYYLATTTPSPVATYSITTQQEVLRWAVNAGLNYVNLPTTASSRTEVALSVWKQIISVAIQQSTAFSQQYNVSGLSGLSGLGATCNPEEIGYDPTQCQSWSSEWGPTILKAIGYGLNIAADKWTANQQRDAIAQAYKASTGSSLPGGTEADVQQLASTIRTANPGMTYQQAYEIASGYKTPSTTMPSWVLPVGIGVVAFMLLQRK